MLDRLLQPAQQLAERPVIPARKWAEDMALAITGPVERIALNSASETDERAALQLASTAEALSVCCINLAAYARGVLPRVGRAEPPVNIIVPGKS